MNLYARRSTILAVGVVLGVGVACTALPDGSDPFAEEEWVLVAVSGDAVPAEVVATLRYAPADGRLSGSAGCNRYFAAVLEGPAGGVLKLGPIGATRRRCPPPAMDWEARVLGALAGVSNWTRVGAGLELRGSGDSLHFEARSEPR